ncbi:unnamed protein product [Moneuplotes crassus]|uniref:SWI/SNF-related matrix-associated actin-dependent regulator of chromatin subfamily A-like protein 1 n=1 Tax=Euplotes crassus TaxID=5936 RepID=A0AAD1XJD1_EUPCR|nr:unnamed protein product [Moneuplotes crassus]
MKRITDNFKKYKKEVQKNFKFCTKKEQKLSKNEKKQKRINEVADTSAIDFFDDFDDGLPEKPQIKPQAKLPPKQKPKRKYQRKKVQEDEDFQIQEPAPRKRRRKKQPVRYNDDQEAPLEQDDAFDVTLEDLDGLSDENYDINFKSGKYDREKAKLRKMIEIDPDEEEPPKKGRKKASKGKKRRRRKNQDPEVSIELYDENLISIKFIGFFNENLKNLIKNRKHTCFDNERKCWVTTIKAYRDVIDDMKQYIVKENAKFQEIPEFAIELMKGKHPFYSENDAIEVVYDYSQDFKKNLTFDSLPAFMRETLYDFQKEGVKFGLSKHGRFLLGDEMGVGKTIQAIAISFIYKDEWPLLIICPSTIKYLWRDEILRWLPGLDRSEIQVMRKGNDQFNPYSAIFIMTYELAVKFSSEINHLGFKVAIVDEAHYLKNYSAKRSKTLIPILANMRRVLLLSGTPILAKPVELFNLLKILRPDIFFNFMDYANRYCRPKETSYGLDCSGNDHVKELHCLLEKQIMIRRLKSDVLSQLPPKRRQKIEVTTDEKIVNKIRAIICRQAKSRGKEKQTIEERFIEMLAREEGSLKDFHSDSGGFKLDEEEKCFLKAYHLSGTAKIVGILEFVETMIENDAKFLIFAQHLEILNKVETLVNKKKVDYIRIDGNVNTELRHQSVRHFQEDPNCLVAILSITASSLGITMTAATNVIFAEVHWTPAHLLQAEDRVHRIGQENSVNIYYLFGKDTMDEIIFPVLRQKSHVISETLDARRTDYNLNIKAKQGLNSEEKENLEREALVRKRDYEKKCRRKIARNSQLILAGSGRQSIRLYVQIFRKFPMKSLNQLLKKSLITHLISLLKINRLKTKLRSQWRNQIWL